MTTEIRVPQLPESVADATLVAWHKQPGDAIRRDENLADLETDKVVLEVPAPANGVVREIRVQSGAVVTSGQVLAVIEEGAAAAAKPAPRRAPAAPAAASAAAAQGTAGQDRERRRRRRPGRRQAQPVGAPPGRGEPPRPGVDRRLGTRRPPHQVRRRRLSRQAAGGRRGTPRHRAAPRGACGAAARPATARRHARRAARADDAAAGAHRAAPDRGAVDAGAAHDLQRGGPDRHAGAARRATRSASRRSTA